jgi:hypothetical protein
MPNAQDTHTPHPSLAADEVRELVGAIQTVRANLQRRAEQSHGIITIVWGIIMFAIMAFYQILEVTSVAWMHAVADYAWLAFVAGGLLATSLVGSTFDRAASGPPRLYPFWHTISLILVGTIVVIALILSDSARRIPGFWILFFPLFNYYRHRGAKQWSFARGLAILAIPLGLAVVLWAPWFSWSIGGLFYGIGLTVLGVHAYRHPEPQ